MDLVTRLRNHALPDPHDEREVLHAPLLREAADEIDRLRAAMLTGASILERDGDEFGVGAALRRAMVPNEKV